MADDQKSVAWLGLRDEWLAQHREEIIDPGREIVDPHHHFWDRDGAVYELDQLWADTSSGHNVVETVFIECHSEYDLSAPQHLQPVGETTYVAALAQRASRQPQKAQIAAIVANADLTHPQLDAVLDAHEIAGAGLFRGIRQAGAWDRDLAALSIQPRGFEGQYANADFRRGVERLGERGLTYDTWNYHPQIKELRDLAVAVPGTTIVLDHHGTPLGVGRFAGMRDEVFKVWQDDIAALAAQPNVIAKLGGMAMPDNGWGWHLGERPPSSDDFVAAQGKWYHHMIACFGPERCMFESNFPVDRASISYPVLWNAFKKIAAEYTGDAQDAMFAGTARKVYRL